MKVWITKYCLTMGIQEMEANVCSANGDMIEKVKDNESKEFQPTEFYHGKGRDWHDNKNSAIKRANEIKSKKIESIKKQLKRIENLKFD